MHGDLVFFCLLVSLCSPARGLVQLCLSGPWFVRFELQAHLSWPRAPQSSSVWQTTCHFELASLVAKSLMSGLNKMFLCLRKGSCLLALTSFSPSFTDKRHKPRVIKRVTQAFSASQQPNQDSSPVLPILSSSIHRK